MKRELILIIGLVLFAADSLFAQHTSNRSRGTTSPAKKKAAELDRAEKNLSTALGGDFGNTISIETESFDNRLYLEFPSRVEFGDLTLIPPKTPKSRLADNDFIQILIGEKDGRKIYAQAVARSTWWPEGGAVPPEVKRLRLAIFKIDPRIVQCAEGDCDNYCTKDGIRQCCDVGCPQ